MPDFRKANPGDALRIPADDWNAAMDAAADFRKRKQSRPTRQPSAIPRTITAMITGGTRDGANFRWVYDFEEVYLASDGFAWTTRPEGITGECRNMKESANGSSGLMGNGVDTADLAGTGLEVQPIPDGWPVQLTLHMIAGGGAAWRFSEPNGVTGPCEAESES